jgi:hypothetical protein
MINMGLKEDLKVIEMKIREIYVDEIQPLEDIRKEIQRQINDEKITVDMTTIDTVKAKYKQVDVDEKLVK